MSDNLKKPDRIKTHAEILKETAEMLNREDVPANSAHPVLERFSKLSEIYTRLTQENEARKSTEQRVREDAEKKQRWAREREDKAQAKADKERLRLNELFSRWCKRDTWLIHDEAIALIKGREPNTNLLLDIADNGLLKLVQSCAGHSLKVVNIAEKSDRWRVEPREWVRWLKEKDQAVPQELIDIILPKPSEAEPGKKTSRATLGRERKKRDKIVALKKFASDARERARKTQVLWDDPCDTGYKGGIPKGISSAISQN